MNNSQYNQKNPGQCSTEDKSCSSDKPNSWDANANNPRNVQQQDKDKAKINNPVDRNTQQQRDNGQQQDPRREEDLPRAKNANLND